MLFDKIYTIDWKALVRRNIRKALRQPVILALLYGASSSFNTLYIFFGKYRKAKDYQLLISPQVCYLKRMLNDRYDFAARRIYISDAVWYKPVYLFQEEELKPIYLYQEEENNPLYLRTEDEAGDTQADFIVFVPSPIVFIEEEMKSLIDQYKLAGRRYKIEII